MALRRLTKKGDEMKIVTTAPQALGMLWEEKVFLKPKDVKTIETTLEQKGYNFTDKNLMMALQKSKFLTRILMVLAVVWLWLGFIVMLIGVILEEVSGFEETLFFFLPLSPGKA